jgi:hypothetical protein
MFQSNQLVIYAKKNLLRCLFLKLRWLYNMTKLIITISWYGCLKWLRWLKLIIDVELLIFNLKILIYYWIKKIVIVI